VLFLSRSWRCGSDGRGVFFHSHSNLEELAIVLRAFFQDRLGNRLRAFPLNGSVEVDALFAAMQLKSALGAWSINIKSGGQYRSAARATGAQYSANHARGARPNLLLTRGTRLFLLLLFALLRFSGILIAVLFIFSIQTTSAAVAPDGVLAGTLFFAPIVRTIAGVRGQLGGKC
jgi:hypothetical protein